MNLDTTINTLIDDLAPTGGDLFRLFDSPTVSDDRALSEVMASAVTLSNLCGYVLAASVAAAEKIGLPARSQARHGPDLLMGLGVAPSAALRYGRVGRAAASLSTLTCAQRVGGVGIEVADAVGTGIRHIESRVEFSDDERAVVVRKLMIQPTPAAIGQAARAYAIAATHEPDVERSVPVAEDADLNDMTLNQNAEGRIKVTLDVDVHTGEELHAALDPLCKPTPLPDGSRDPRSVGQRRAEALGHLVRTYLSRQDRPTSGGMLPHVTLIRPAEETPRQTGPAEPAAPAAPTPGEMFLAAVNGEPVDTLGFTGPISPATAELICCDASLQTVIVDHHQVPLDLGRTERLFPPHLRKALAARDRGCAHPGCGAPVAWTDAHHIIWWEHHGTTSLDNGVLLCRRHHRAIHHGGWQVYMGKDRHPWFIPPRDPNHPDREPPHLPSHARRTLTNLPTAA